jgi:YggT family protein
MSTHIDTEPARREHVEVHDHGDYEHRTRIVENANLQRTVSVNRLAQFIWLLFGILEGLLGLRFFLKLIAANPANTFANLIYSFTDMFLWPFAGITGTPSAQGMVLEIHTLIAIVVYALLAWVLVKLTWILFYHPSDRQVEVVEREHDYD